MNVGVDSVELLRTQLENLSPTDHLCVPYRGRDEQFAVAIPFIRIGLGRGERCMYVEGDVPTAGLVATMKSLGFDAGPALESGALSSMSYPGPYVEDGRFDPERMIHWFLQKDEQARGAGFSGLRYVGEMTWALGPYPGVERLAEYEAKLNAFLHERPMPVLCQYDRGRFPKEIVREMIATHPQVVAHGSVCANPFYVPPEKYLSPDWPESEIDWLLQTMSQLQHMQGGLRESEERYRTLARQLLDVQERERRSIALEVHDQLGQVLTAIRLTLRGRQRKGRIAEAVSLVDEAIEHVRSLALALRPPSLDHLGLPAALRAYVEQQAQRMGVDVNLTVGPLVGRFPPEVETASFRMVQEAFTNIARHSGARHVDVALDTTDGGFQVLVRDDGRGFDVRAALAHAMAGASLGLRSMEERVSLAGGRLEIESEPGRGTTLRARFPVPGERSG